MKSPFTLAPDSISHDTRACLAQLHEQADDVIGIAYAVMYKGRNYIVNTAGEMHRNPTFARGAVAALDDELRRMVWGEQ